MVMADKTQLSTTVCAAVLQSGHEALLQCGWRSVARRSEAQPSRAACHLCVRAGLALAGLP